MARSSRYIAPSAARSVATWSSSPATSFPFPSSSQIDGGPGGGGGEGSARMAKEGLNTEIMGLPLLTGAPIICLPRLVWWPSLFVPNLLRVQDKKKSGMKPSFAVLYP